MKKKIKVDNNSSSDKRSIHPPEDNNATIVDEATLRQVVFQKMEELKLGDLFVDFGLAESDYAIVMDSSHKDHMQKFHAFRKAMVSALNEIITGREDSSNPAPEAMKKKKATENKIIKKRISQEIVDQEDFIITIMTTFAKEHQYEQEQHTSIKMNKKKRKEEMISLPVKIESKRRKSHLSVDDCNSIMNDENNSNVNSENSPVSNQDDEMRERDKRMDRHQRQENNPPRRISERQNQAKVEFERTKADVLARIPIDVAKEFRNVCFVEWNKEWLPAIQLGPYDVPPANVRDQWMQMFHRCLENRRPLTRLVYWYGSMHDNLSDAFSFVPKSKILDYGVGCSKGCNKMPPMIQRKIDKGVALNAKDLVRVNGLKEIEEDFSLASEKRLSWIHIIEDHEELEGESIFDDVEPGSEEVSKPKRGKKKKQDECLSLDEIDSETDENLKPRRGRKKKTAESFIVNSNKEGRKNDEDDDNKCDEFESEPRMASKANLIRKMSLAGENSKSKLGKKKNTETNREIMTHNDNESEPQEFIKSKRGGKQTLHKNREILRESGRDKSEPQGKGKKSAEGLIKVSDDEAETTDDKAPNENTSNTVINNELKAIMKKENVVKTIVADRNKVQCELMSDKARKKIKKKRLHIDAMKAVEQKSSKKKKTDRRQLSESEITKGNDDSHTETLAAINRNNNLLVTDYQSTVDAKIAAEVDEEDRIFEDDITSEAENDEDFEDEDHLSDDEELASDDAKKSSKSPTKRKTSDPFRPLEGRKNSGSTKLKPTDTQLRMKEQIRFTKCEDIFVDVMNKLTACIESKDPVKCLGCLNSILDNVKNIHPSFIQESRVGTLIKNARLTFQDSNEEVKLLAKKVTSEMKRIYTEREPFVPKDFKPKKSRPWAFHPILDISKSDDAKPMDKPYSVPLKTQALDAQVDAHKDLIKDRLIQGEKNRKAQSIRTDVKSKSSTQSLVAQTSLTEHVKNAEKMKQVKKSFSLAEMFQPKSSAVSVDKVAPSTATTVELPKWLTEEVCLDDSFKSNSKRALSIEFLLDASTCLQSDRVNHISIAYALERAIFAYAGGVANQTYWEKIHDLSAAIAGKKQVGTIAKKIVAGHYATPQSIVAIPRKYLYQSFEGYAMTY